MKVDLHVHTRLSDGVNTAAEVLSLAQACDIKVLSITNHDLTESIAPYAEQAKAAGIQLIEGIELSALLKSGIEIHLLGYYIDGTEMRLQKACAELLEKRMVRFHNMLARLQKQGIDISFEDIRLGERGLASRMHLAYALVKKGDAPNTMAAMETYLVQGRPAYIANEAFSAGEAIDLIKGAGGIPVLAHPFRYKLPAEQVDLLIKVCKDYGLEGLEVFYPTHSSADQAFLLKWCNRLELTPTCGTDYHKGTIEEYRQRLLSCGMDVLPDRFNKLIYHNR